MIQLAHNAVVGKLVNASHQEKLVAQEILSYKPEGFGGSFGNWDGKASFFDYNTGMFPAGFAHYVQASMIKRGHKVGIVKKPLPEPLGPELPHIDDFGYTEKYDYQPAVMHKLLSHGQIIAQVATGGGKCLGKDTPVMLFDGTVKPVQDIAVGDLLMGPDSKPRRVLSTCVGNSELYKVTPTKGDSYVVNDAHILSLKRTAKRSDRSYVRYDSRVKQKGDIVNINVEEYLNKSNTFKHTHKGWRTGVEFETHETLTVDPYFLGIILGDGTINGTVSVTTADSEIVKMLEKQASVWGLKLTRCVKEGNLASAYYLSGGMTGGTTNSLMLELRGIGFCGGENNKSCRKFIPHHYKTASREDRLSLLAGILDSDGYYDGKCFYLTLKEEALFDDTLFLARSLGFAAYKKQVKKTCHNNGVTGSYFAMVISGDLNEIPVRLDRRRANARKQKKNHLVTGLKVEPIGKGDYYGFEIDGDHLFLLGDFTVTHNTRIATMCYARIGRRTLFLTTRNVLMYQMKECFEENLSERVAVFGDGFWQHPGKNLDKAPKFNVGMVQTFAERLKEPDPYAKPEEKAKQLARRNETIELLRSFEFVILEEAHEVSGNGFYDIMCECKNAHYRLALTATPFMKDNEEANMRLMAVSGSIAIKITEQMLIERGVLARPIFKYFQLGECNPKLKRSTPWQRAYNYGIVNDDYRNKVIAAEIKRATRYGLTGMVLVQHKEHGYNLMELFKKYGIRAKFIFGDSEQAERKAALAMLGNGELDVLIGSTILDVGVDVPSVGFIVLAGGGKAEVALRQRIGRGLRAKKFGPNVALILDFSDHFNTYLREHAVNRRAIVEKTPGFNEGIIRGGGDFNYEALGFVRIH